MNRPQTCADVRQTGCRGRRPLRCGRRFPRRGDPCGRPPTCTRVRQAGRLSPSPSGGRWRPPSHGRRLTDEGEASLIDHLNRCGRLLPHHPLRGSFPRWGKHKTVSATCADVRQTGRRGRRPLRCGRTFPRKFRIPNSSPSLRQLRQLRRLFPRRKLSQAVAGRRAPAHL